MRAYFSRRHKYEKLKHYREVLHQEGRVWLDSDWNAQAAATTYHDEARMRDLVGDSGAPALYEAFRIEGLTAAGGDFRIGGGAESAGDFYVDGILCRNESWTTYGSQPDLPVAPPLPIPAAGQKAHVLVYLEVWQRLISYLEDDAIREVALGGPDTTVRSKTIAQVRWLPLEPIEIEKTCGEAATLLPSPLGHGTLTTLQAPPPPDPADICRLPDEITFTGRENRLDRVEIHEPGDVRGVSGGKFAFQGTLASDTGDNATSLTLKTALSDDAAGALRNSATIVISDSTRRETALVTNVDSDRLTLRLASRLESRFAAGAAVEGGIARFKWSSSNGAFAVGVTDIATDLVKLTLASLGRDNVTALRMGDLVEISDDASELGIGRGHLTRLAADPNPDELTVVLADRLPSGMFDLHRHVVLRRWDGEGFASAVFDEIATPDMNLGSGVHIQFGGNDLRVGEWWQFTTRVIDGSVEPLTNAAPHGIVRHRCTLAVLCIQLGSGGGVPIDPNPTPNLEVTTRSALAQLVRQRAVPSRFSPSRFSPQLLSPPALPLTTSVLLSDCRPKIPRLTRMLQLHYVSGDGQEAVAGQPLARPLVVGVTNGPFAMAGAKVQFSSPQGTLSGTQPVITGTDGTASCSFTPPAIRGVYVVTATLVLSGDDAIVSKPLPVIFNAKAELLSSCCTIVLRPMDLHHTSLQAIVNANKGGTICLRPGRYVLPRPLVLEAGHGAMTIEGCGRGVVLASESTGEFLTGMIHLLDTTGVTLRNLEIEPPRVTQMIGGGGNATVTLIPLPVGIRIGVRVVDAVDCTIEDCTFRFEPAPFMEGNPELPFGAAVLAGGGLQDCVLRNNTFDCQDLAIAGIVATPALFQSPDGKRFGHPCTLDGICIEGNRFDGLSHAVLLCGELREIAIRENSIEQCGHGFIVLSSHWFAQLAGAAAEVISGPILTMLNTEAVKLRNGLPPSRMAISALALSTYAVFHPTIVVPLNAFATLPQPPKAKAEELGAGSNEPSSRLVQEIARHAPLEEPFEDPFGAVGFIEIDLRGNLVVGTELEKAWQSPPFAPTDFDLVRGSDLAGYFSAAAVEATLDISHNAVSRNRVTGTALLTLLDDGGRYVLPIVVGEPVPDAIPTPSPAAIVSKRIDIIVQPGGQPVVPFTPKAVQNRMTVSSNDLRTKDRFFAAALLIFERRCTVTGNVMQNEIVPLSPSSNVARQGTDTGGNVEFVREFAPSLVIVPTPDRQVDVNPILKLGSVESVTRAATVAPPRSVPVASETAGVGVGVVLPIDDGRPGVTQHLPLLAVAVTGNTFTGWPVLPKHTSRHSTPPEWWHLNIIED